MASIISSLGCADNLTLEGGNDKVFATCQTLRTLSLHVYYKLCIYMVLGKAAATVLPQSEWVSILHL